MANKNLEQSALLEASPTVEPSQEVALTDSKKVNPSRAKATVALRLSGAGFADIAEIEGFASASVARKVFEESLAASLTEDDLQHLRSLTDARLNRLMQSIWPKAINQKNPEQLAFLRAALSISDRLERLHGIAAPQRVEVYTPDERAKQEWLEAALARIGPAGALSEEDIIDAEVVGDDDVEASLDDESTP